MWKSHDALFRLNFNVCHKFVTKCQKIRNQGAKSHKLNVRRQLGRTHEVQGAQVQITLKIITIKNHENIHL